MAHTKGGLGGWIVCREVTTLRPSQYFLQLDDLELCRVCRCIFTLEITRMVHLSYQLLTLSSQSPSREVMRTKPIIIQQPYCLLILRLHPGHPLTLLPPIRLQFILLLHLIPAWLLLPYLLQCTMRSRNQGLLWLPASLSLSKKGELNILNLLITLRILGSHFVYTSTFKMATKLQRTQQSLVSSVYRSPFLMLRKLNCISWGSARRFMQVMVRFLRRSSLP